METPTAKVIATIANGCVISTAKLQQMIMDYAEQKVDEFETNLKKLDFALLVEADIESYTDNLSIEIKKCKPKFE